MNIYVGNLDAEVSESELNALFTPFGEVKSARVIKDKESGESRGFAFVEMPDPAQGAEALKHLDGSAFHGARLKVNEARPKPSGPRVYNSFSSNFGYRDRVKY